MKRKCMDDDGWDRQESTRKHQRQQQQQSLIQQNGDVWKYHVIPFLAPTHLFHGMDGSCIASQVTQFIHTGCYTSTTIYQYFRESDYYRLIRFLLILVRERRLVIDLLPSTAFLLSPQMNSCVKRRLLVNTMSTNLSLTLNMWQLIDEQLPDEEQERMLLLFQFLEWKATDLCMFIRNKTLMKQVGQELSYCRSKMTIDEYKGTMGSTILNYSNYMSQSQCSSLLIDILYSTFSLPELLELKPILLLLLDKVQCARRLMYVRWESPIWKIESLMLEFIPLNGYILRFAPDHLKNDRLIALNSVKRNHKVFEYLSNELRDDEEIAFHAIREIDIHNCCSQFRFVSQRLANSRSFVMNALDYSDISPHLSPEMKRDAQVKQKVNSLYRV